MDSCGVKPFQNQVAGVHGGKLSVILKENNYILKPYKLLSNKTFGQKVIDGEDLIPVSPNELEFYKLVDSSEEEPVKEMARLMPKFYGSRSVKGIDHLVLEDITEGMKFPCVVDIKLGLNRNYPGRAKEKLEKDKLKYLSASFCGFSLSGMLIHDKYGTVSTKITAPTSTQLSPDQIWSYLESFFKPCVSEECNLIDAVIGHLEKIRDWVRRHRHFILRGSSVLVAYDAHDLEKCSKLPENISNGETSVADQRVNFYDMGVKKPPGTGKIVGKDDALGVKVRAKMIDFAHVFYANGNIDDSYLNSLEKLLQFLISLRR